MGQSFFSDFTALHALADPIVALACASIALTLFIFARRRRSLAVKRMCFCFAMFFMAFGVTHLLERSRPGHGTTWLSGLAKAIAAAAAAATAMVVGRLLPRAPAVPRPDELALANAALRDAEDRFRAALDGIMDAFFILRAERDSGRIVDFTVVDYNERAEHLCAVPARGRRLSTVLPAARVAAVLDRYAAAVDRGIITMVEVGYADLPDSHFEERLVPTAEGLAVTIHDVSERKRAELLRGRLAAIVESSDDAIYSRALDGRIETWNAGAEKLFGWSAEEIIGQSATRLERHKNGGPVDVAVAVSPIHDADGTVTGHAVIARDVSTQQRAERQITASLREKEVLLTEVHHRVKNNLQVICSLLSLQASKVSDPRALEMFRESQDRVRSIAVFHEHLYQSKDLSRVDIGAYLRALVTSLLATYHDERPVRADVQIAEVSLGVDRAIPCGLLVNELVSNALKHAFPEGRPGVVRVALRAAGVHDLVLTVDDDGVGLPESLELGSPATLGHQLVMTLARQLGGAVTLDRARGARFTITFSRDGKSEPVGRGDGIDTHC